MYLLRGSDVHPGANYVIRPDGRRIKITENNKEELAEKIERGWVVERQLMDGDTVLFNRQPSLHKMSIMAHQVKVLPNKHSGLILQCVHHITLTLTVTR